jgi:hypothetical protein
MRLNTNMKSIEPQSTTCHLTSPSDSPVTLNSSSLVHSLIPVNPTLSDVDTPLIPPLVLIIIIIITAHARVTD